MRYYFHIIDNDERKPDEVGLPLASDDAARAEAARFLADLAREMISEEGRRRCDVEVVDEDGRQVTAIGFWLREGPDRPSP